MTDPVDLVYFLVTGNYYDVENPNPTGTTNQPWLNIITGFVTFYPRIPADFVAYISAFDLTQVNAEPLTGTASSAVALAPIQTRILSGQLQSINQPGTPGIYLTSNSAPIQSQLQTIPATWLQQNGLSSGQLIYDVQFTSVIYEGAAQSIGNFGFTASVDTTPVCITDPELTRLAYGGPT